MVGSDQGARHDVNNHKSGQHWKGRAADNFKRRNVRKTRGGNYTAGDGAHGADAAGRQLHTGEHPLSVAAYCLTNAGDHRRKTKERGVTGTHHKSAQANDQEHDRIDDEVAAA